MAEFNPYNLYSYAAGQMSTACDDKILVDLQRFKSIHDIDEVKEYIEKTFGSFDKSKIFNYKNNVMVFISKSENDVSVIAHKEGKQIYGNRWYVDEEE